MKSKAGRSATRKRWLQRTVIAGSLIGGLAAGIVATSAAAVTTSWATFPGSYQVRGHIINGTGMPNAGTQTAKVGFPTSPAGYLGGIVQTQLGTAFCGISSTVYNQTPIATHGVLYNKDCGAGNYRSIGLGRGYNASTGGYHEGSSVWTPYVYVP